MNASIMAETTWRSSRTAVQLTRNFSY